MAEKKEITCFLCKQNTKAFYFRAGRAVRISGYAHDAYPCSSMVAENDRGLRSVFLRRT